MADTKITELTALTAPVSGDLLAIVDISDTTMAATGTDKKMTLAYLFGVVPVNIVQGDALNIQTDKVRARDGDGLYLVDDGDNGFFIKDGGDVALGHASPLAPFHIKLPGTAGLMRLEATAVAGYASFDMYDSAAAQGGGFGYGNANAAANFANRVYLYGVGKEIFFSTDTGTTKHVLIDTSGNVIIGAAPAAGAQLHVDQVSDVGAIPVLYLDQADVSEEMIEFNTTIGIGNAIEAVGAKTLTTTHFIKVTLPGPLTRYIPCGTIA